MTSDAALSALNLNDGSSGRGGIRTALDAPIDMLNVFAGRGGRAVWQDQDVSNEQLKRLAYGVGDIASFIARMPLSRKFRDAGRGYDQWQRGEGTPFSLIMPRPGK